MLTQQQIHLPLSLLQKAAVCAVLQSYYPLELELCAQTRSAITAAAFLFLPMNKRKIRDYLRCQQLLPFLLETVVAHNLVTPSFILVIYTKMT